MAALIQLAVFLLLLLTGYFFGRRAEARHYQTIVEREAQLGHILLSSERLPPPELLHYKGSLVMGNVVISVDYFKVVAAALRNLFGGRIAAYESLLDRARREALLRMQQEAEALGAETIINTKLETSRVSGDAGKGIGSMEVLAYGTALVPPPPVT